VRDHGCLVMSKEKTYYIDCLSNHKHDWMFTFEAWDRTIEKIQEKFDFQKISQLFIFGDGALKTKENIYFWKLANQHHKIVDLNYFGPYHGHSEIDAHFGNGKRKLRMNAGAGPVFSKAQIVRAFSDLPNTTVLILLRLNRG